jgi:hypothetical protein
MIEEERETGFEHRAPKKKPAGAAAAGGTNGPLEFTKIVKLDTAIVDADAADPGATDTAVAPATTEVTATKMATMMSYYNKSSSAAASAANYVKRPSDTLIKCFKIDDLELDESKVGD